MARKRVEERWLPIPECPGYEASDQGNVRSAKRVLAAGLHDNGKGKLYRRVVLRVAGRDRHFRVAGLVLSAHVGPRPAGQQARHLDDNSLDDRLANLAWGTPIQNSEDAARNGSTLFGERNPGAKLSAADVAAIRAAAAAGVTQASLAKRYGVHYQTIFRIVHFKRWKEEVC